MKKKIAKRRLLTSAAIFALFYLLTLLLVFVMIVINQPHGWHSYFRDQSTNAVLVCVCIFLLYAIIYYYYYFEDIEFLSQPRNVVLVLTVLLIAVVINYALSRIVGDIYIRPVALPALMFVFLLNRRRSIMLNFVFAFMMFVIDRNTNMGFTDDVQQYFGLLLTFVGGTVGIFLAGGNKTRGGLMLTGVINAVPAAIMILIFTFPEIDTAGWLGYLTLAGFGVAGSLMSAMFALCLLPIFEKIFSVLTVFRLSELTSTNAPILVKLKTEAPGTFNHSLIVAHLSESCAVAIGENAELARAAGYYHDVGKLKQPECFAENQSGYNIHDELMPELSADIVRSHAKDGYEFLIQAHMPEAIASVAREHHGTLPIKYFYNKAVKLSGEELNLKDYSYLGPTPRSKIAAIVMIADASEATVRAFADRSAENVERIVRGIIEERMDLDQFADCNITIKDLAIIKETLVGALSGVHHHRVKYPAIRFNRGKGTLVEDDGEWKK